MIKKSWLFLLPLLTGLLWVGASPTQAAGELWKVLGVNSPGCTSNEYNIQMSASGITGSVTGHTVITSGGLTYTNDETPGFGNATNFGWNFVDSKDYGPVANPGSYPIPAGQQVKAVFMLENPKGTVLSSWTLVIPSCDSSTILYNGLTSADPDEDFLTKPKDKCPTLKSFRANGCPLRDRTLVLRARYGPKRVVGKLSAPGYPTLAAGRTVTIWKVRPGPDLKVATRTTGKLGGFKARVAKGRYYAVSKGLIVPTAGQVWADRSTTVRIR